MSERLRVQYPEQMTIILQHQFWDLAVNERGFEVGLSFGGIPEKLGIPFEAINGFFDPSVQFGLQFEEVTEGEDRQSPANVAGQAGQEKARAHRRSPAVVAPAPTPARRRPRRLSRSRDKPAGGGEVVRLDRFRKK